MTINTQTNVVVAQGNGATNPFSYNFLIPLAADAQIIYTDATGANTTLNPAQYTITGIGNPAGGTVTYPIAGPPIASGTSLTIARILPLVQATTLSNQGNQYPAATEGALDYEMMALQQVSNQTGRALVAPITDATAPAPLPTIAQRANQFLGFDSLGNPIAGAVAGAVVSAAMQPVVAASTVAAALALLGGVSISALVNWTAVADANAALGAGLYTYTWTTLTASRTATLRAASTYTPGQQIIIEDGSGNASPAILITAIINPAPGTDTIVGASAVSSANGRLVLVCDGVSKFYGYRSPSVGTLAGQLIALDSTAKLPPVDGSNLTNLPIPVQLWPLGSINGLTLSRASATTFGIATGITRNDDGGTGFNMTLASAITKSLSAWAIGSGNGGLDTGAIAPGWYHAHLIRRDSDGLIDATISLSPSAPTMPGGWTARRRIGSLLMNGSSQITAFIQNGDIFTWDVPVLDVNVVPSATTAQTRTFSVPTGVVVYPMVNWLLGNITTAAIQFLASSLSITDSAPSLTLAHAATNLLNANFSIHINDIPTNTSGQYRTRNSAGLGSDALKAVTTGWIDTRGK
jgi:hypothetical protein